MIKLELTEKEFELIRLGISVLLNTSEIRTKADREVLSSLIGKFIIHLNEIISLPNR
jgi:hypothetical protein